MTIKQPPVRRTHRGRSLVGMRFGRLVVTGERMEQRSDATRTVCVCLCDCGREYVAPKCLVAAGTKQACGCVLAERRHGMSHKSTGGKPPRLYTVWRGIRSRCLCENATGYKNYGGRGIAIDPRWDTFRAFRADVLAMLPPGATDIPKSLDVDRIDNDGPYAPGNVQFSTRQVNLSHRRGNVHVTIGGATATVAEWCRTYGITASCVRHRVLQLGWDMERAITVPKSKPQYRPRKAKAAPEDQK